MEFLIPFSIIVGGVAVIYLAVSRDEHRPLGIYLALLSCGGMYWGMLTAIFAWPHFLSLFRAGLTMCLYSSTLLVMARLNYTHPSNSLPDVSSKWKVEVLNPTLICSVSIYLLTAFGFVLCSIVSGDFSWLLLGLQSLVLASILIFALMKHRERPVTELS